MRQVRSQKIILLVTVLIFSVFSFLGSAGAFEHRFGPDTNLDFDVTVSYGIGARMSDRDDESLEDINNDDAQRNFDQYDIIGNKISMLADIDFKHKNFGLFVRPKAFYDHVYMTDNANDSPETNNAFVGGLIDSSDQWADEIEDIHGMNAEVLDLFGYYSFFPGGHDVDIRVGKQVIAWGEGLLIAGIGGVQSPIDASAAVAVGTEVKEVYIPTETVYFQAGLTENLGLGAYYQWKWEKTKLMEGGTFFAASDTLDEIRAPTLIAPGLDLTIPWGPDEEAKDDGQYGISLNFMIPTLDGLELGAYFINYHDKNPIVLMGDPSAAAPLGALYKTYTEDIKLYGVSFSTVVGLTQVGGEFSYQQDVGFQSSDANGNPMAEISDYWQAQISVMDSRTLYFFADKLGTIVDVACGQEVGREDSEDSDDHVVMKAVASLKFEWLGVFPFWNAEMNLKYGDVYFGSNWLGDEDDASYSINFAFVRDRNLKLGLTWEDRLKKNMYEDRDTLTFEMSYNF